MVLLTQTDIIALFNNRNIKNMEIFDFTRFDWMRLFAVHDAFTASDLWELYNFRALAAARLPKEQELMAVVLMTADKRKSSSKFYSHKSVDDGYDSVLADIVTYNFVTNRHETNPNGWFCVRGDMSSSGMTQEYINKTSMYDFIRDMNTDKALFTKFFSGYNTKNSRDS